MKMKFCFMEKGGLYFGFFLLALAWFAFVGGCSKKPERPAALSEHDSRMEWWREARFGLFIHWGLYAIPAGEWNGETNHAEWIRTTARIPLEVYDRFVGQFNPLKFDAGEWVRMAKEAGMKYIVITSKHHDGFCLFDSQYTDFDVMSTPFGRDILKELSEACRRAGIKMCWYHSIMDWHHPDYLPRRDWEKDRSAEGADFDRYVRHMKDQLAELVGDYGEIGVLWFDGEWESTWNHERGRDLYEYVRRLQPNIIINNRVDVGRSGMQGLTKAGEYVGDFGTPEQEIPPTGLPGVDWETCMTMNDNWGYNKNDHNWKSNRELVRKLADIASKGGNFLLNVGPTAEGEFPPASVERLRVIGEWMKMNGEAIYGTQASPFRALEWGRCTQKPVKGGTRLYLHVFDWPPDGRLVLPGIFNAPRKAFLLADPEKKNLFLKRVEDAIVITLPGGAPDPDDSVVVLDIEGLPDINDPPEIRAAHGIFIDSLDVHLLTDRENVEIRYALSDRAPDSRDPVFEAPIRLTESMTVSARCFRRGKPVSGTVRATFTKVPPRPAVALEVGEPGVSFDYYEGDWERMPDFSSLKPAKKGGGENFVFETGDRPEKFGFVFSGFIEIQKDGVYSFFTESDDGSRLFFGPTLVVDNDGLHGPKEAEGAVALAAGFHPIRVEYFNRTGGHSLKVSYQGPGIEKSLIPKDVLRRLSAE
jgi:alpha-L-fucosidase